MSLRDRLPERLNHGYWHWLLLLLVFVFLIDEFVLIALAVGGLVAAIAVVVAAVLAVIIITQTDWGERRWHRLKQRF